LGGDEFAILLPQTNPEGAEALVGRLTKAISEICFEGIYLAASIGRASFPQEVDSAEKLLVLADQRMYTEKESNKKHR
jgi:diguanylate cyclase (GGDEF)-like protein